jgi:adenine-specific DNA-methyltransferase
MGRKSKSELADILLALVPPDGAAIGNQHLCRDLAERLGRNVRDTEYDEIRGILLERGDLLPGKGRGGSVRLANAATESFDLAHTRVEDAGPAEKRAPAVKRGTRRTSAETPHVISYRHAEKRRNNPEVGMVDPDTDPDEDKTAYAYDPHLDPALQFDVGRAQVERIIDDALESGDEAAMREALLTLKRIAEPYLNWSGKAERTSFDVDTVPDSPFPQGGKLGCSRSVNRSRRCWSRLANASASATWSWSSVTRTRSHCSMSCASPARAWSR